MNFPRYRRRRSGRSPISALARPSIIIIAILSIIPKSIEAASSYRSYVREEIILKDVLDSLREKPRVRTLISSGRRLVARTNLPKL